MAAKRVIAVLAAVLLIVGAVFLRRAIDDPDEDGPDRPSGGGATVACIQDLADACRDIDLGDVDVVVESFSETLADVAGGTGPDAWITFAPLERLAVDELGALAFGDPEVLGSTRLALASRPERVTALAGTCGGAVTWTCIGESAGQPWSSLGGDATWGDLAPGHDDPTQRATGLLTMGSAAAAYFGSTTFNAVDIDADPGFLGWFSRLERSVPSFVFSADSALDTLATGRAVDLVGASDAEVARLGTAQSERFTVAYPEPVGRADAVLVISTQGDVPAGLAGELRDALLATPGWVATPGEPNGIPSAGVLRTLLDLWESLR
ncbi:MAG: hypothetical protein AB7Q42_13570 [Acidimicrobiia bacterium]